MKFTPLIISLIILPIIALNMGMSTPAGQNNPAPVQSSAASMPVVETISVPGLPAQASFYPTPTVLPAATAYPLGRFPAADLTLNKFVALLKNGQAGQVVGVYIPGVLALRVKQQPAGNPAYVNAVSGYATQFGLAAKYGAIGLLAHNYLSGALFSTLWVGQTVHIIYGDGSIRRYGISTLRHFQAINPTSSASDFVDIDNNSSTRISNSNLFYQIYAGDRVVFQTCITAHGNTSWGRLFVIATPIP